MKYHDLSRDWDGEMILLLVCWVVLPALALVACITYLILFLLTGWRVV